MKAAESRLDIGQFAFHVLHQSAQFWFLLHAVPHPDNSFTNRLIISAWIEGIEGTDHTKFNEQRM